MLCKKYPLDSVIKQGVMNLIIKLLYQEIIDSNVFENIDCWYMPYKSFNLS